MKKIKKEVKTEVEVFIAENGEEFDSQIECENYERKLRRNKLLHVIEKIEKADIDMPPMGYEYVDTDRYTYFWFNPKSEQEIAALGEYFWFDHDIISSDYIRKWVGVEFEGGPDIEDFEGDAYLLELDVSIKRTVEFYEALGYCIEISKSDTGDVIASSKDEGGVD